MRVNVEAMQGILWDLDGTIMNSGSGIMHSVQYALDHFGMQREPEEKLRRFVGPSLMDSFTNFYGMHEEDAKEAVRLYREVYESGNLFDAEVYDGVEDVLRQLKEQGKKNIIVTSKPHMFADRIVDHFGLRQYLTGVVGTEPADPSSKKGRLIEKAVKQYALCKEETVMIGDTRFDIEGAREAGVCSIGVAYGFGTEDALSRAGADAIVYKPEEILRLG